VVIVVANPCDQNTNLEMHSKRRASESGFLSIVQAPQKPNWEASIK